MHPNDRLARKRLKLERLQKEIALLEKGTPKVRRHKPVTPLEKAPCQFDSSHAPLVTIECDGGTSCNIPGKFGYGYGSYCFDGGPAVRVEFGKGHSNNSAEILIIAHAFKALHERNGMSSIRVLVRSDSKTALGWVTHKRPITQISAGSSQAFKDAIITLKEAMKPFPALKTQWRGRAESVRLFGH